MKIYMAPMYGAGKELKLIEDKKQPLLQAYSILHLAPISELKLAVIFFFLILGSKKAKQNGMPKKSKKIPFSREMSEFSVSPRVLVKLEHDGKLCLFFLLRARHRWQARNRRPLVAVIESSKIWINWEKLDQIKLPAALLPFAGCARRWNAIFPRIPFLCDLFIFSPL